MENLETLYFLRKPINTSELGNPVYCHLQKNICCYVTDTQFIVVANLDQDTVVATKLPPKAEHTRYIRYIQFHEAFLLGNNDNLVVFHPTVKEFDIVFQSCQTTLTAFCFNPADNFLVVANGNNELLGFSYEGHLQVFTLVNQTTLDAEVPNSVYVGWGSHNTQFKGAQLDKAEDVKAIDMVYEDPEISWRGNGEQFVVNYWQDGRRLLKVFDSCLNPLYKSEPYPNLSKLVSFKGQGNCIACTAVHKSQNKIVIFEKNCLVKTEFFIPENEGEVKQVLFHPNKNLFAVHSQVERTVDFINVYMFSNAKWRLKQQLRFTSDKSVLGFSWVDIEDTRSTTCKLSVATLSGFEIYTFRSIVNRSPIGAVVTCVEGRTAKFTFFENEINPPPYCTQQFICENPINRIFFHPVGALCLILDASFTIRIIEFNDKKLSLKENMSIDLSTTYIPEKNMLSFIDNCFTEREVDFNFQAEFFANKKEGNILPFNDTCENVASLDLESKENRDIVFCTGKTIDGTFYEFALTYSQKLLVNKMEAACDISSIITFKKYLLLTQGSKLFTICLNKNLLRTPNWNLNKFYCQDIEQGIKLVSVIRKCSSVLVYIPRGNIECVASRVITIDIIEDLLEEYKWVDAATLIRKEKLNWNLLIDLNPVRFENNVNKFIEAVEPMGILPTLAAEINNENCLQSIYSQCIPDKKQEICDKSRILRKILHYLNAEDTIKHIITIVTILSRHFSIKSAIKTIYVLFNQGQEYWESCEEAVSHLLLYFNKQEIIAQSYTIFDTHFLRLINLWCGEDPSTCESEIKRLDDLPIAKARFEMSIAAREFGIALKHLLEIDGVEPSFINSFIMKYNIYNAAYTSVSSENKHFGFISKMYGEYLSSCQKYDEAAFVFLRANMVHEALEEYKKALNWNQVLTLIKDIDDPAFLQKFLKDFAKMLIDDKQIDAAVFIYIAQLNEYLLASTTYLEDKQFQNAFALARRYQLDDLIEHTIKPAIVHYQVDLSDKIGDLEIRFNKYSKRLQTVRNEKTKKFLHDEHSTSEYNFEADDLFSDYGSTTASRRSSASSRNTKSSTTTSRNVRKENKKKIDLREGGYYEDIALIRQLYILITEAFSIGQDVRELSLILLGDEHMNKCKVMQVKLGIVQNIMKDAIPEIWSEDFLSDATSENLAVIHNKEHLEEKYKVPPSVKELDKTWRCVIF